MTFQPAKKLQVKLKLGLYGPSNSGKTYSALRIARGLVGPTGRIAVIDSEMGTSAHYANKFKFDLHSLKSFEPNTYIQAVKEAVKENYDVIILDSITHEWNEVKESVETIADLSPSKNTFAAWKIPSAMHQRFMNALLQTPVHIIVTMREKDEYELIKNEQGKAVPMKVGVKADQRKGVEYEFSTVFHIDRKTHIATVEKDRTELFQEFSDVLTEQCGEMFRSWLVEGEESPEHKKATQEKKNTVHLLLGKLNTNYKSEATKVRLMGITHKESMTFWTESDADLVIERLQQSILEKARQLKEKQKAKTELTVVEPKQEGIKQP